MHSYLFPETNHTQPTRALFSRRQAVGVRQWDVYLETLAESLDFSPLVLLLCDLQCRDSMTPGAGSGAPTAPPLMSTILVNRSPPGGSSQLEALDSISGSVESVHCVSIDLWLQTSVKPFHRLLHGPLTYRIEDIYFFLLKSPPPAPPHSPHQQSVSNKNVQICPPETTNLF